MISVGFGTNDKWTSRLIRWVTRSPWSHVWIEYPSGVWGGRWVAHSWADGVVKVPIERTEATYPKSKIYECMIPVDVLSPGFSWARHHISAGYDYGVIWNGFLLVLYRSTGWNWLWKIVARNATKFSCSEFVCGFLKAAGVNGTESLEPELTTPGDLEKFCAGSDDFAVV
jgi:hypothetical protein